MLNEETKSKIIGTVGIIFSKSKEGAVKKSLIELCLQTISSNSKLRNSELQRLMKEFISFTIACLTAIKNPGGLKIEYLFKTLLETADKTIMLFMENVCLPHCRKGHGDAISLLLELGRIMEDYNTNKKVHSLLISAGEKKDCTETVLNEMEKFLPRDSSMLGICPKIDRQRAFKWSLIALDGSHSLGHEQVAMEVVCSLPANKASLMQIASLAGMLMDKKTFVGDREARSLMYTFVKNALKNQAMNPSEALKILTKAFHYETCKDGLAELIKLISWVDKEKSPAIIFDGMLKVETSDKEKHFDWRKETVEKYLNSLENSRKSLFLQAGILKSKDSSFLWYAAANLLACETSKVAIAAMIKAVKNGSPEKAGSLVQFALNARDRMHGMDDKLKNVPKQTLELLAQEILACTQTKETSVSYAIVKDTIHTGKPADIAKVLPILHSIILQEDKDFKEAVYLLLICNWDKEKKAVTTANKILDDLFVQKKFELMTVLNKLLVEPRIWGCTCLCSSTLNFLSRHNIVEVMPLVEKTLEKSWRQNDINYACVHYLTQVSIAGSVKAVGILIGFESYQRISVDTIPKSLVEIYHKTNSEKIKELILKGFRTRFLKSIEKSSTDSIFYLSEFEALQRMRSEGGIFDAFISGIASIGKTDSPSPGMATMIEEAVKVTGKKNLPILKNLLSPLIVALEQKKDELPYHSSYDESRRAITTITQTATAMLMS